MSEAQTKALISACYAGDLERVVALIGDGADPSATDVVGWFPLYQAACGGDSHSEDHAKVRRPKMCDGEPIPLRHRAGVASMAYTRDTTSTPLPRRGQTGGSYSRNLNHLWATGAIVLLWDTPIVEWYYPGLTEGATHLVVNAASAAEVLDKANADPEALEALRVGAQKVDDEHVCAFCLEDYFRRVFNAIRERVSYHLVLDDPATILQLAESEGACDAFYEAVVVRRVEAEGVYHDVVRRGCNLCVALRAEVRGEVCRVEGVN